MAAVYGDAADPAVLVQAHIARASMLVIAVPGVLSLQQMITTARALNPKIEILVCSVNKEEVPLLEQIVEGRVFSAKGKWRGTWPSMCSSAMAAIRI